MAEDAVEGLCVGCLGRLAFDSDGAAAGPEGRLRLGNYELLEEIARGGMGVVYRARQSNLNRIVAVKVLLHGPFSSAEFVRRFQTEAEAAAALRHPNIVSIYEIGEHDGHHFLSMEYIEGRNLSEVIREQPMSARRAAACLKTVAEAVEHAHQNGVVHRDLKPSNILLDALDAPRVTDFGLAKLVHRDSELTTTGQLLGSRRITCPPEQAAGKFSESGPRSDIYSLGAILYQLLTRRPPFEGETLADVLAQVQTAEPIPPRQLNPAVPADLQTICLKCLHKEPERRYATARELAEDLGRFLDNQPILARPVGAFERAWRACERRPVLASLSFALALAVLVGLAGILLEWHRSNVHAQGETRQRLAAEASAAQTRLNLYAADISVAAQAWQNGNIGLARRTIEALKPKAGETDLRGFEWYYLSDRCRGDQLYALTGHEWIVTCAAFSPDGKNLATGSQDGTVRIWDLANRTATAVLRVGPSAVWSVAFTPDGKTLMSAGHLRVQMWDLATREVRTNYPGQIGALSKSGTMLATAESSPFFFEWWGPVILRAWPSGEILHRLDEPGRTMAFSPDGKLLAVAAIPNGISLWDTATGKRLKNLPTPNSVWSLSFSPDGRRLLSAGWSSDVSVWTLDEDSPVRTISGHHLNVWSAVFSPDGATIATTGSDQTVRLWSSATLAPIALLRGHGNEVWCAAFSPEGALLASGGKDQAVMLWSTSGAARRDTLPNASGTRPIFSADGKWLVTANPAAGSAPELWRCENPAIGGAERGRGASRRRFFTGRRKSGPI